MLYLINASTASIRNAMAAGEFGQMCTPAEGRHPLPGVTWAGDTGLYGAGYPGDDAWTQWLRRVASHAPRCAFITAPDVFDPDSRAGDAAATLARSAPWLPIIRALGYPAALIAQDGLEHLDTPWDTFDVLFLGFTAWPMVRMGRLLLMRMASWRTTFPPMFTTCDESDDSQWHGPRRPVIGTIRVQEIVRGDGRRTYTIVWPDGSVYAMPDAFLRTCQPGTSRTY